MRRHPNARPRKVRSRRLRSLSPFSAGFVERYTAAQATRQRPESSAKPQEFVERAQAARAEFDTNIQRRNRLTPEERLKEDGERLFQSLKLSPDSVLVLQLTPKPVFRRARCRATECLYGPFDGLYGAEIRDKYRISLEWSGQSQLEHYHVRCMECMVPLPALARSQFRLDGRASWSLMIAKWLEHRGRINIEKIAAYFDREAAYSRWFRDTINEISNVELQHQLSCNTGGGSCQCPPFPRGPKVPVLKEYITSEDEVCGLWDVICRPHGDASYVFFDEDPPWARVPPEELEMEPDESSEARSKTTTSACQQSVPAESSLWPPAADTT